MAITFSPKGIAQSQGLSESATGVTAPLIAEPSNAQPVESVGEGASMMSVGDVQGQLDDARRLLSTAAHNVPDEYKHIVAAAYARISNLIAKPGELGMIMAEINAAKDVERQASGAQIQETVGGLIGAAVGLSLAMNPASLSDTFTGAGAGSIALFSALDKQFGNNQHAHGAFSKFGQSIFDGASLAGLENAVVQTTPSQQFTLTQQPYSAGSALPNLVPGRSAAYTV